jgi:cytochrome c5
VINHWLLVISLLLLAHNAMAAKPVDEGKQVSTRELNGREVYVQTCAMCHANGVGGAPRPGRADDWIDRSRNGTAELLVSVLRGKGAMPPKGGNASLTRAEAYVALDFMLNGLK